MALACVQPACQAAVFYVDSALPQSGDGTSWAAAFKTVQEGVGRVRGASFRTDHADH